MKHFFFILFILSILGACDKPDDQPTVDDLPVNPETPAFMQLDFSTDKAFYQPGEKVVFTIDFSKVPEGAQVRMKHLNNEIEVLPLNKASWDWLPPATDFRGYMAEVFKVENETETICATVAFDVSSVWTKFPRYGFLSDFGNVDASKREQVLKNLNRHHINGLQYYDWHNKHHQPLPVVDGEPARQWKDIINKDVYFSTVEAYIAEAKAINMKSMFYNLVFGAWKNAEDDGVKAEWYVYNDPSHTNRDFHPLSSPFLSNIYLLDPSNSEWQDYLLAENRKVYEHLDFDGFHMDQLGERGTRYKYDGSFLDLAKTYQPFIEAQQADQPSKYHVMNAVNQYGQEGIAAAPVDFLYTEVWDPFKTYLDLSNIIKQNNALAEQQKNTVLAAYVNYDLANRNGYFNTASVLMTNAVIFAFGASHLELGEHMLAKEYFPNNNLELKTDLKMALVNYYDFLVAYQNLLRDGGTFQDVELAALYAKMNLAKWPAAKGFVAVIGKRNEDVKVVHLINFKDAVTDEWRDPQGVQSIPAMIKNTPLVLTVSQKVRTVWTASPDVIGGASRSLPFMQEGSKVSFTLPELKYWSMLVFEYE
ncbi:MAG: glycoside hydrolase family 66 protein [Prolixibacteraceae bacterium]|nr:glycoside hydrolase family 66 protein [Prolixibacteraceae bacterium]